MNTRTALLMIDRFGRELAPLDGFYAPAIIPITGKTPLEFWLERLSEHRYTDVFICTGPYTRLIKQAYPNGEHWGLRLHYLDSRGEEHPELLLERYRSLLPDELTVARGDVLPNGLSDTAWINRHYYKFGSESSVDLETLHWPTMKKNSGGNPLLLIHPRDLLRSVHLIMEGQLDDIVPRGLPTQPNHWVATHEFSAKRAEKVSGSLYVGRNARVMNSVQFDTGVCIEQGCYVDQGAALQNALVMPGTYIGKNVSLDQMIACGSFLIDLKHQTTLRIEDPELISPIIPSSTLITTPMSERIIALLILGLTAPLALPLLLLTSRVGQPRVRSRKFFSNRGSRSHPILTELIECNCAARWVNRLPALVNIIEGDLRLFGTPIESIYESPPLQNLPLCQGVFNAQHVHKLNDTDELEQQLWGMELAGESLSKSRLFTRALRSLFTGVANGAVNRSSRLTESRS